MASWTEEVPLKTTEGSQTWETLCNASSIEPENWFEILLNEEISELSAFTGSQKPEDNNSVTTRPPVANSEILKTDATWDAPKTAAEVTTTNSITPPKQQTQEDPKDPLKNYRDLLTSEKRPQYSRLTKEQFETLTNSKNKNFFIPYTLKALIRYIDKLVNPEGEIKFDKEVVLIMASKRGFLNTTRMVLNNMAKWTDPNGEYKLTREQIMPLCKKHSAITTLNALDNYLPLLTNPDGKFHLTTQVALFRHFESECKLEKLRKFFKSTSS